jgi:hypothetical protein
LVSTCPLPEGCIPDEIATANVDDEEGVVIVQCTVNAQQGLLNREAGISGGGSSSTTTSSSTSTSTSSSGYGHAILVFSGGPDRALLSLLEPSSYSPPSHPHPFHPLGPLYHLPPHCFSDKPRHLLVGDFVTNGREQIWAWPVAWPVNPAVERADAALVSGLPTQHQHFHIISDIKWSWTGGGPHDGDGDAGSAGAGGEGGNQQAATKKRPTDDAEEGGAGKEGAPKKKKKKKKNQKTEEGGGEGGGEGGKQKTGGGEEKGGGAAEKGKKRKGKGKKDKQNGKKLKAGKTNKKLKGKASARAGGAANGGTANGGAASRADAEDEAQAKTRAVEQIRRDALELVVRSLLARLVDGQKELDRARSRYASKVETVRETQRL